MVVPMAHAHRLCTSTTNISNVQCKQHTDRHTHTHTYTNTCQCAHVCTHATMCACTLQDKRVHIQDLIPPWNLCPCACSCVWECVHNCVHAWGVIIMCVCVCEHTTCACVCMWIYHMCICVCVCVCASMCTHATKCVCVCVYVRVCVCVRGRACVNRQACYLLHALQVTSVKLIADSGLCCVPQGPIHRLLLHQAQRACQVLSMETKLTSLLDRLSAFYHTAAKWLCCVFIMPTDFSSVKPRSRWHRSLPGNKANFKMTLCGYNNTRLAGNYESAILSVLDPVSMPQPPGLYK